MVNKNIDSYFAKTSAASNLGSSSKFSDIASYFTKGSKNNTMATTNSTITNMDATIASAILNVSNLKISGLKGTSDKASSSKNISSSEAKKNNVTFLGLSKIASLLSIINIAMNKTPLKGVVDLLKGMMTMFLVPIGMLLLTLFKPFLIFGIKSSIELSKWITQNTGLMQVVQGLGEILSGAIQILIGILIGAVAAPILALLGGIIWAIGAIVEIFTGFEGIKDLGSDIMGTSQNAITGATDMFNSGVTDMIGGFIRLSVAAVGGSDALDIISNMNTQEIVDVLFAVKQPATDTAADLIILAANIEGVGDLGLGNLQTQMLSMTPESLGFTGENGVYSVITSGGTKLTGAFDSIVTQLSEADIVQKLVDAALGRIHINVSNIISDMKNYVDETRFDR